jgi:4-diphosphocytidyl-2-C-methyl-D-erythritol kinase
LLTKKPASNNFATQILSRRFKLSFREKAYAKINLHLEILNKRDDGYHNIFGLFASINFFDLLKLEQIDVSKKSGDSRIQVKLSGGAFSQDIENLPQSENLVVKAAGMFLEKQGLSGSLEFSLEKNIPAGGGLGGGSSDAAAALRLLNRRFPGLKNSDLEEIAGKLGSDIPYCLEGGIAICEERGELMEHVPGSLDYYIVAANCGIHIDTGWAYSELDRDVYKDIEQRELDIKKGLIRKAAAEGKIAIIKDYLKNDFQEKVFEIHRDVAKIYENLIRMDAEYATMTGSGSTVLGLFSERDAAEKAAEYLDRSVKFTVVSEIISDRAFCFYS